MRCTWVLPVLADVAGELGALVTISCRLKLRPWSRLLADGAAHTNSIGDSSGTHAHTPAQERQYAHCKSHVQRARSGTDGDRWRNRNKSMAMFTRQCRCHHTVCSMAVYNLRGDIKALGKQRGGPCRV